MRPLFHPRLVNSVFDDPGLFIPFLLEKRAVLFDLGDIHSLSAKDILKISHVFITHTHIDHFCGFDRLLRLFLGREKLIYMYGPAGFLKNIEGKLSAYSWNLVDSFSNQFAFHLTEVHEKHLITNLYMCRHKFRPVRPPEKKPFSSILYEEPALSISTVVLDHSIPCLGFAIRERFHVNIKKDGLDFLGLETGPWLHEFKQALFNHRPLNSEFEVNISKGVSAKKKFILADLVKQIAIITPGQKITYIADVVYNESNTEKMIEFAKDSDHLFIEAAFLDKHKNIAETKNHLTARQAGTIAAMANVKQFTIFHFSPRYAGQEEELRKEAQQAYDKGSTA
ncbi:MAG: MBL fold metallo-hydrolase [Thermodesulfobacteriota bacterium]|nr:MBL fold metallo-hydrolase [Thermodesulfobacteriota bacterium]